MRQLTIVAVMLLLHGCGSMRPSNLQTGSSDTPTVVVIPTLGTDHQFNLDYTVAHLASVLDAIEPDAVVIGDYTEWLNAKCIWAAVNPEYHLALRYAEEKRIPVFGTRTRTSPEWYPATVAANRKEIARNLTADSVRDGYRKRLDQTTARIARDYSFNPGPQSLEALLRNGFAAQGSGYSARDRELIGTAALATADSISRVISAQPQKRTWAIILPWSQALPVAERLRSSNQLHLRPVSGFLDAAQSKLNDRMDFVNLAWILSGVLDEWFGMWAPQVFPSERIAALLRTLERMAPNAPMTLFLRARWLMQNRDYDSAQRLLTALVADTTDARIPFPINPKWIRPPWSSIRQKTMLNLAFIHDIRGQRNSALVIYNTLLAQGEKLNSEAQAAGYNYDDIRSVMESYVRTPYTGIAEEAFRHFPATVGVPSCDPHRSELLKQD